MDLSIELIELKVAEQEDGVGGGGALECAIELTELTVVEDRLEPAELPSESLGRARLYESLG